MKIYLVGGAVRDEKLRLPIKERDWCVVGSSASELISMGFKSVGKSFPVFLHPKTKEEYALARIEKKTQPGYHGFKFNTSKDISLEEDLQRRDLTINAMAKDEHGSLIDPYDGLSDIKNKVLRHVSTAFKEDPVRVLRTAKFAARYHQLGFKVAKSTMRFMASMVENKEIDELAPDRIWKETEEVLNSPNSYIYFQVLEECNAFSKIYPKMVINYDALKLSAQITNQAEVHFAVMLFADYDLCDPNYIQKDHRNIIRNLAERLPLPNSFTELADLIIHYEYYKDLLHINAEKILTFLNKTDAFRRNERFRKLLKIFEIIEKNNSRSGKESEEKFLLIKQISESCDAIQIRKVVGEETDGQKIKKIIHQKKIDIINSQIAKKIPR
jgi:tRNA nucleotidyltransferase (CCA-adding enzyme)